MAQLASICHPKFSLLTHSDYSPAASKTTRSSAYNPDSLAPHRAERLLQSSIQHRGFQPDTTSFSCQSALAAVRQPRQQSGQGIIRANTRVGQTTSTKRELDRPPVDTSGSQLRVRIGGQGRSVKGYEARTHTQPPNAPGQVYRNQAGNGQTTTRESPP